MSRMVIATLVVGVAGSAAAAQGFMPRTGPYWTYPQGFGYRWSTPAPTLPRGGVPFSTRGELPRRFKSPFVMRRFVGRTPVLVDHFGRAVTIDRFGRVVARQPFGRFDRSGRPLVRDRFDGGNSRADRSDRSDRDTRFHRFDQFDGRRARRFHDGQYRFDRPWEDRFDWYRGDRFDRRFLDDPGRGQWRGWRGPRWGDGAR